MVEIIDRCMPVGSGNFPKFHAVKLMALLHGGDMEWDDLKEMCRERLHTRVSDQKPTE
jgi:hypothetical protein